MSKVEETVGFYRKMSDLQERLRRSEEERLQLEEKFALLMRACRDEEEARLNDLRERYETFLEEEKQRRERNDRILEALERIESRAAILTAKSERLKLLRRHYEAFLLKMYPGWKYVTDKFTDGQPSTPKFDPLNNKLNLEADRNNPYRGVGSSPSLFPADRTRRLPLTLHHDDYTVGVIPPSSVSRTTVDMAPATVTVDGLPPSTTALPTDNVIHTQQTLPVCVVTDGERSVSEKEMPVCTQETFNSSQNSVKMDSNKINELDDYLGRAAKMLKLSRAADNMSVTNLSRYFREINPDTLKDTKHLGSSVDFELEQNTSGDILNVSLSDDGILQEESNRTLLSSLQNGDQNKNTSQTTQVKINAVNNNGEGMNKRAELVGNVNNKDILLNKNAMVLHHELKPAYSERKNQETVKGREGDAPNFKTALGSKGGGEFDNQQHLYHKNVALISGGDSVIPDKSIYIGETIFETEEQSGLSERKQQYSKFSEEEQNHDKKRNGQKQVKGFEMSGQSPKQNYYIHEDSAIRQEKRNGADESSAQGFMGNKREETRVNESIYRAEGAQPDQQYKAEESGDIQLTEQQYAEQHGGEYYRYGEGEMYQQHTESEPDQQYGEHCVNQEEEQQYGDQVEGQCDQEYRNQHVDQEGLQYSEQEGQYEQQEGQYDQQAGQYDQQEGQCDQYAGQYDQQDGQYEQQAGQYDQQEGQYEQQTGQYDQQEGQYDQQAGQYDQQDGQYEQQAGQYDQQEGQYEQQAGQYDQQEGQYEQQAGQYDQQEGHYEQQTGQYDQQYMEYQADQYDQYYEAYQQEKQEDNQLLLEQHVSDGKQPAQHKEDNCELGNQEDTKEECDQISELIQRQHLEVQGDRQEISGDINDTSSFEDGKHQEQMEVHQATESDVGNGSQEGGSTGAKEEKSLIQKEPDLSSKVTQPSSSRNVAQHHQLFGETGEPEQSDTDELELQLAALVELEQTGEKHGRQLLESIPTGEKMTKQIPVKVTPSVAEVTDDCTTVTDSSRDMTELASRTDTAEVVGHEGSVRGSPDAQSKMPNTSSKPENEPVAVPVVPNIVKTSQPSVPRPGSKKLPGLTKMLESDTESLQLDATMSNEDSDDFDFSSDK